MNQAIVKFLQETLQRIFQKSPTFFKWWQIITGVLTCIAGIPFLMTNLGITLPEPFATMSNKAVTFAGGGAFFMSLMAVRQVPVAQTEEGKGIVVIDEKKLPFTAKSEEKKVQETVPQPPVIENVPDPSDAQPTT